MTVPFTYLIGWKEANLFYYGVRFARGCRPEDLWSKYFTSSKRVPLLRETLGEPDVLQVRRTFTSVEAARSWELRVLKRMKVRTRKDFINIAERAAPVGPEFMSEQSKLKMSASHTGKRRSKEHRAAISAARVGGQTGKWRSQDTKEKMRAAHLGKKQPHLESTKHKISEAQRGHRWWTNGVDRTRALVSPGSDWRLGRK